MQSGATERAEVPPHEPSPSPVDVTRVTPRWFGVAPASLLLVGAAGALAAGVVLAVVGSFVAALVLLGLALLLLAGFLEVARRKPDVPAARRAAGIADSLRTHTGFAAYALRTRAAARREVVRRRAEIMRLHEERERLLRALGAAVYDGADGVAEREHLHALDLRVAALEAEVATIAAGASEELARASRTVQPTEIRRRPSR